MRQQPKPFIVEIKSSRKPKADGRKTSIWGKLDLSTDPDTPSEPLRADEPAVPAQNGRL